MTTTTEELSRLEALRDLQALDKEAGDNFDRLTTLIADLFDAPIATVALVDETREWFMAAHGTSAYEGARDEAFCAVTIESPACLVVEDASVDPRFAGAQQVVSGGIRFYAGAPIRTREGHAVGALSVRDFEPRTCSSIELRVLEALAQVVAFMLDMRKKELVVKAALDSQLDAERREAEGRRERLQLAAAVEQSRDAIVIYDRAGQATYVNPAFSKMTGHDPEQAKGIPHRCLIADDPDTRHEPLKRAFIDGTPWAGIIPSRRKDGTLYEAETTVSPIHAKNGEVYGFAEVRRDITKRRELEAQLAQAQRLESIGQLAAGIAHEINTPAQYVGDNTRFLKDSFADLIPLLQGVKAATRSSNGEAVDLESLKAVAADADVDFLLEEIPPALDQSLDGITRISTIVAAMKAFSHPSTEKAPADLPSLIQSTITVAANEWKYVADIEIEAAPDLPHVPCVAGDFNQVVLNLVVNAAHAIGDVVGDTGEKGLITIGVSQEGDEAVVRISDTGGGMPPDVLERVFDPFFTTKEVGRGTGQGLFLAQDLIVNKHGGALTVASDPGVGTTFTIRLPLQGAAVEQGSTVP